MTIEDEEENKPLWKKALNKVQDFVADPKVNTASRVATGMLNIASQIGQAKIGGPVAWAGAAMGTLNVIQNTLGVERYDPCEDYTKKHPELRLVNSSLPITLEAAGAMKFMDLQTVAMHMERKKRLRMLAHKGKRIMFLAYGDDQDERFESNYWIEEGFDKSILREYVWRAVDAPIVKITTGPQEKPVLEPSPYDDIPYLGQHSPQEFAQAIEIYRQHGISRASLLEGPPGTGKTSFVRAYARSTKQTLVIVPPDFLGSYQRSNVERIVKLLVPDIVLLDDIDRAPSGLAYAMDFSDAIRREFPRMVMISTVNVITKMNAALLRPGRLGERRKFLAPPDEDKIALLKMYMSRYGVDESKYDLDVLVRAMNHPQFSHDYVRFTAEQAVVLAQDKLLTSIEEMVELLEITEDIEPTLAGIEQSPDPDEALNG